ncbi:Ig-like domain-containing protein, partial [Pseudomonas sp. SDT291_1_S447]
KRAAGGTSYAEPLKFDVGVALDLTAPSIKEAPNGTSLDPFAGKDTLNAVVDYVGMLLNDEIIVTFSGAPGTPEGGSHITDPWTVRTLGPQDIPLDNTVIAFNLGQSVTVSYTVARGSDDPKDSKTRTLEVLPIKNEDNRLPDPVINGITSAELDVTTLPGQPRTRIAAWLLLALKQTLWLRYFVEGNPTPISTTYNGAVIPPDGVPGGMHPYTPMAELNKLADGAKLRIEFKVGFDGSTDESKAVVFPSRVYTMKAVKDVRPEITSVKDSKGAEIVHDGGTVDPVVTLTGTAAPNQQVEVFEGAASRGKHPVDGTGIWTYTATLTAIGTRTFKAKADYGSGQESAGRILTYSNAVIPAITSVKDSKGVEIPKNTVTLDTSIKLTGTGTPRLQVEIFDGVASKGKALVNATTGKWELEVKDLSLTVHNFKARALYGTGVESAVWTLTVTAATAPTLTSVKGSPSGVEIPDGTTTREIAVTLSGVAAKGQQIEVFDGTTSKDKATAHATTGVWTLLVSDLSVAAHSFKAKALYGAGQESEPRSLIVSKLTIDLTPMILNGIKLFPAGNYGLQLKEVNRNTATRTPTDGARPYTYEPIDDTIASVDANGKVSGLKNGSTSIIVTDDSGSKASYDVTVSNVYTFILNDSYLTPSQAKSWMSSVGAPTIDTGPIHYSNFSNFGLIYGGVGESLGRYSSNRAGYPEFLLYKFLLQDDQEGVKQDYLTGSEKRRAMAYIPRS